MHCSLTGETEKTKRNQNWKKFKKGIAENFGGRERLVKYFCKKSRKVLYFALKKSKEKRQLSNEEKILLDKYNINKEEAA